jgi:hypothetical protein
VDGSTLIPVAYTVNSVKISIPEDEEATSMVDYVLIGNLSAVGLGEDTGEPFLVG